MDIYTETILDHYQHPHHAGALGKPTISTTEHNPLCGDVIRLDLKINKDTVEEIGFVGNGCAISQASMSMLADYVEGKKISVLKKLKPKDIYNLLGITISPGRTKCALLGLNALQKNLH
ncbi:MAG: SUF system NifU family Fe-S cluster assembly protein [Candidatus Magasanikbacteria bacterium RIFOXYD2_FULL_39_9]|uniref:SUF system NifU family Fe-S cluster assembly protein n=1 Tax=Candidatus Magasanikbacteria bacterium RIFOXYD1_FULL_40_23 TaxID=1798705 RepID=A0A1F6P9V6_9BACT|nr:MAG: SUF system NifU family Fe-S cluster assembly protein [Candidatus Magasanikbacteria bacterium RIFOXYD2_FULL_39_9]OGH92820.1 MAG: SUF system NifU family Fe-S cluster assembly protein [Candidatus Magasanikbacteria bacterium RIFOXYD1_FULL_40_23]